MRSLTLTLSVSATLLLAGGASLAPGARANTGAPTPAGDTTTTIYEGTRPQGSGTCAGPASSSNVREGQQQLALDKQNNKDVASAADCSTKWQQLNSTISPDQRNALNASLKTGDASAVTKVLTTLGVDASSANQLANYGINLSKTGDSQSSAKTGEIGINAGNDLSSKTTTINNRDDNRVFAPNLSQVSGPVIPGQDRYILRNDCGEIETDLTVSPVLKSRKAGFAIFGIALSGDFSSQKFEDSQRGIQEQVITLLHASVMRSAERGSSYSFTRSAIMMSLESAKRSGLNVDVPATMADLDAQFMGKTDAWKQARNEAIANRNALCKPVTPPPVYREVPPPSAPEMVKLCLATSDKGGRTVYSTVFVSSALGLKIGDRYQNSLVTRIEKCSTPF
jgi:hypothetical protein